MRWRDGDTRARHAFLLLPRAIGGEWRWLEWAYWIETYDAFDWEATEWVNK